MKFTLSPRQWIVRILFLSTTTKSELKYPGISEVDLNTVLVLSTETVPIRLSTAQKIFMPIFSTHLAKVKDKLLDKELVHLVITAHGLLAHQVQLSHRLEKQTARAISHFIDLELMEVSHISFSILVYYFYKEKTIKL
jgi:hypothetical protein